MKRTSMMITMVLLGTLLLTLVSPVSVKAVNINLVSDPTWTVLDTMMNLVGNAQNVCLNANSPLNCPVGAPPPNAPTLYGYTLNGWIADLSSIPGATWIWAPKTTGQTSPAANAEFIFQKEFYLCGAPQGGTIFVAADDNAEVFLNGASVPVLTSASHAALSSASIPATSLAQGLNIIQVKVKNGANPSDCGSDQYNCNPAGMVFGASFADALTQWPTCTSNGKTYTVGQFETLSCDPGQVGSKTRPCVCIGSNGIWGPVSNACTTSPKTCTGNDGTSFSVGSTETISCPTGLSGSASRTCQADGSWGTANTSACVPPPVTCTGTNGAAFNVGVTEMLPCDRSVEIGAKSRTCQADGTWSLTSSTCHLPLVGSGDICGSSASGGYTATCPSGTTCGPRITRPPKPSWCAPLEILRLITFGLFQTPTECNPIPTQSTDWYCDP